MTSGTDLQVDWRSAPTPPGGGELVTDPATLRAAATDLGNIVHAVPGAVLRPHTAADVATILAWCTDHAVPWRARGTRHTTHGQGVVAAGGLQIDMRSMAAVHAVGAGGVVADAGATLRAIAVAAAGKDFRLAAGTTGYTRLTVGGVCSVGGISNRPDVGALVDSVSAAQVVTAGGHVVECTRAENAELMRAVLGGFGEVGVLTRVTLDVADLPGRVRTWQLPYGLDSLPALLADLRTLARRDELDELYVIFHQPEPHTFRLTASTYFGAGRPAPEATEVLRGLNNSTVPQALDLDHLEHIFAVDGLYDSVAEAGWSASTKIWTDVFLPDSGLEPVVTAVLPTLTAREFSPTTFGLIFPKRRSAFGPSMLALPAPDRLADDREPVFLFDLLKDSFGVDDPTWASDMLARHTEHVAIARQHGGVLYPIGTPAT
ncbi:FAD-binding protein [Pseudonocardia sp. TRM90224]|uniref:FAD-binding protein n=1 Tax=Pseudonocardia sp. TRM90224 TaxID=2812678 RepID=UPI001E2BF6E2|nr:FAD-binding protein [Pseudonocardia sp. TRM90224]